MLRIHFIIIIFNVENCVRVAFFVPFFYISQSQFYISLMYVEKIVNDLKFDLIFDCSKFGHFSLYFSNPDIVVETSEVHKNV